MTWPRPQLRLSTVILTAVIVAQGIAIAELTRENFALRAMHRDAVTTNNERQAFIRGGEAAQDAARKLYERPDK
jgi:hypothetical protein